MIARTANGAAIDPRDPRARSDRQGDVAARQGHARASGSTSRPQAARRNVDVQDSPIADYIAALRKLVAAYPDDLEAKSILGLALLDGFDSVTKAPRAHTPMEGIAAARGSSRRTTTTSAPITT